MDSDQGWPTWPGHLPSWSQKVITSESSRMQLGGHAVWHGTVVDSVLFVQVSKYTRPTRTCCGARRQVSRCLTPPGPLRSRRSTTSRRRTSRRAGFVLQLTCSRVQNEQMMKGFVASNVPQLSARVWVQPVSSEVITARTPSMSS